MEYQRYVERRGANHTLHLFLSIITCGLWLLVWPIAGAMGRKTVTKVPVYMPPQYPQPMPPVQPYPPQQYAVPPAAGPYGAPAPGPYNQPPQQPYGQQPGPYTAPPGPYGQQPPPQQQPGRTVPMPPAHPPQQPPQQPPRPERTSWGQD